MDFDVFLSHNGHDKPSVRELKRLLVARGLRVWLDEDELQPGLPWQELLEAGIETSASVAVLIGPDGLGPWEDAEMQGALRLAVANKRAVIPVLLLGSPAEPQLPMFLGLRTWVDLRDGFNDERLEKLIWGITGIKPQSNSVAAISEARLTQSSAPTQAAGRRKSPNDYTDARVKRVAGAIEEQNPLTMRALVLELNQLFNRSTFRFEPLRECITKEWGSRLHGAMQTLELLWSYSTFVADQAPEDQTFEKLMDAVNGYCLAMANNLFRGAVKVSELRDLMGNKEEFLRSLPKPKTFTKGISDEINERVDGPRIRAIEQMDQLRADFVRPPRRPHAANSLAALSVWSEKLAFLEEQEAIVADAAQKFALRKQIEEARAKILELGG